MGVWQWFADAMQRLGYERADKVPGTGARVYLGVSLKKLDYAANRTDHYHLTADDECCFLYEYTSGKNYSFSETNNLISNLKKKPPRRTIDKVMARAWLCQFVDRRTQRPTNPQTQFVVNFLQVRHCVIEVSPANNHQK
jgi:hypothetical protein